MNKINIEEFIMVQSQLSYSNLVDLIHEMHKPKDIEKTIYKLLNLLWLTYNFPKFFMKNLTLSQVFQGKVVPKSFFLITL